jgi:hypothetical protein
MPDNEKQLMVERISKFLSDHKTTMSSVADHLPHIFEANCYVLFARHYENSGYLLEPFKLFKNRFRFRFSTAGNPWNFSFFGIFLQNRLEKGKRLAELRHNQTVAGFWHKSDGTNAATMPLFALDVAVTVGGSLPDPKMGTKRKGNRYWVNNEDLITFAESKKLVAYPMLLAQFFGVVHELQPKFVGIEPNKSYPAFVRAGHPLPTLFTSEKLVRGALKVLDSFKKRKLKVRVVWGVNLASDDTLLARLRGEDEQEDLPRSKGKEAVAMKEDAAKNNGDKNEQYIPY